MASIPQGEVSSLVKSIQSQSFLNRHLSQICQLNGLKGSGIKAEMQKRIVNFIQEIASADDYTRFRQVQQSIHNVRNPSQTQASMTSRPAYGSSSSSNTANGSSSYTTPFSFGQGYQQGGANGHRPASSSAYGSSSARPQLNGRTYYPTGPTFKDSPFYQVEARVGDVRVCDVMSQHRHTVSLQIKLQDHPVLQQCVNDKASRVMVFCAGESYGIQEIAFPHQSEIKVNGDEIKANLRGLKNKPGTTRPVDITGFLRLRQNYSNTVEFTYALTPKKFYLVLHVCKISSVTELVTRIEQGKKISKESVVREIAKKAQDTEIETTSQVLSLKCPLTYMRLNLPCRSLSCTHIQCFDATSYLQLQEQSPQWLCPICNKTAPFDQLAVDEYVRDILSNTASTLAQVTIEPDGKWLSQLPSSKREEDHSEDLFDDDFEISGVNVVGGRAFETPSRSMQSTGTPATAPSRESSTMPRGSTSAKRPPPQVIDLTLSSDEDDEPITRPAKRQKPPSLDYGPPVDSYY